MKHIYYKCPNPCPRIDRGHCMFCDGGLGHCTVCDGFEGTLTTDCPGRKITKEEEQKIYFQGTLDFVNGEWVDKPNYPRARTVDACD